MTELNYLTEVPSSCGPEEGNFAAFVEVMVLMPQITATIREWEFEAKFMACVKNVANLLVGKYNIAEHKAYQGLQHGRLSRIFELAGVFCQP
jgi:hypothetical protein